MRPEDYQWLADLCANRAGLRVDPDKTYLIDSRLAPVARREGFSSPDEMLMTLRSKSEERITWALVEAMAVGETSFFRDRAPFDLFRTEVLPALAHIKGPNPVRVWSAACGAGQEVYSLAMVVEDQRGALPTGGRVELFGSDLSERALEKAQSGLYTQFEIQRGLPVHQLVRHFEKADDMWVLSPRIRQMVRWRRINLVAEHSTAGGFDVIFCRYVLGKLTAQARPRLLENLARALSPDGFLFLGEGETAHALSDAFNPVEGRPGLFSRNPSYRAAA